jgi:hypothetical protein
MKVKVVQEWVEDPEDKTGWIGRGWCYADSGDDVPDRLTQFITVTDEDKHCHPIEGELEVGLMLSELKALIDRAVERAGDTDPAVEVWIDHQMRRIVLVNQFGVVPDVLLFLGDVELDFTPTDK